MIKRFRHKGLQLFYEWGDKSKIKPEHAKRLAIILARLETACELRDVNLPGLRLHSLHGESEGHYAVWVSGNWRVTFRFEGPDVTDVNYMDYH